MNVAELMPRRSAEADGLRAGRSTFLSSLDSRREHLSIPKHEILWHGGFTVREPYSTAFRPLAN
jgi:hypothetical protein